MDNIRDIQKTENISQFVDKQTIKTLPFGDNKMGERAYRRAERIAAAIYLLTNHLSSDEPIRNIVRDRAANLLGDVLEIKNEMRTVGSQKTQHIEFTIRHLISLVRILAVAGFVSFENADILTDALDDLGMFVQSSRRSVLSESVRLSRDELIDVRDRDIGQAVSLRETRRAVTPRSVKDSSEGVVEGSQYPARQDTHTINARMEGVMQVLQAGREMGIKDIALNLPEYSEKMIQRELASLVSQGKVEKTGLKRWSRYSIITTITADREGAPQHPHPHPVGPLSTPDQELSIEGL